MATIITGVVLHATEWTPLAGVTVYGYSTSGYTEGSDTSDANGRFLITSLTDRDWMAKLAAGQAGRILLVPTDVTPPTHVVTTGQTPDDHHPYQHLSDHHTGGAQALSLGLIAGTVTAPGHGDQSGEETALHAPTDLVGNTWKLLYCDGSGDVIELALGAEGKVLRAKGAAVAPAFEADYAAIPFWFEGGGEEIADNTQIWLVVPFDCEIESVTILPDQAGGIVFDLWVDSYDNWPPTDADTITGGNEPEVDDTKDRDITLTDWSKGLSKGDIILANVDSCTDITICLLSLGVRKCANL